MLWRLCLKTICDISALGGLDALSGQTDLTYKYKDRGRVNVKWAMENRMHDKK